MRPRVANGRGSWRLGTSDGQNTAFFCITPSYASLQRNLKQLPANSGRESRLFSVFTGSRDLKINILDPKKKYKIINSIDMMVITNGDAIMPRVRSICINANQDKMLVGTFGSEIYELEADT